AAAAAGELRPRDVDGPGRQRPGDDHVQAADRRERPAAHRHLRQDADLHALDDEPVTRNDAQTAPSLVTNQRRSPSESSIASSRAAGLRKGSEHGRIEPCPARWLTSPPPTASPTRTSRGPTTSRAPACSC